MNSLSKTTRKWIWPSVGATPVNHGLDTEMFDQANYPYSETFVREAIQNSLDARLDSKMPVSVDFRFCKEPCGSRKDFLETLMEFRHKAGLTIPHQWKSGMITWLVVQDFNSTGLSGNLLNRTSDFWSYWLNFGLSNKDGSGRGGRGIGRVTFLIASRIQSVLGYTRRSSDQATAVCGMAALRPQLDGKDFLSTHAYLAREENGPIFYLHDNKSFQQQLRKAFLFTKYDHNFKSGLALAIPYPHKELVPNRILAAALENFAPSIMNDTLVLNVNGIALNADSISQVAREVTGDLKNKAIREDPKRYLYLIKRVLSDQSSHEILIPNAQRRDYESLKESNVIQEIQQTLANKGESVLKIAFPLLENGKKSQVSLRAVVSATPMGKSPLDRLFREGMSLPNVRSKNPGELDLILSVEDRQLARYLNFCEGKAHLDLLESKEIRQKLDNNGFEEYKVRGKRLVKPLSTDLRRLLTQDVTDPDASVFDVFFSVPINQQGKKRKALDQPRLPNPLPPQKPRRFNIVKVVDGFRITANPHSEEWPVNLRLISSLCGWYSSTVLESV